MSDMYKSAEECLRELVPMADGINDDGSLSTRDISRVPDVPCSDSIQLSPDAGWTATVANYTDFVKLPFAPTGRALVALIVSKANPGTADIVHLSFSADGITEHAAEEIEIAGAAGTVITVPFESYTVERWPYMRRKFTKADAGGVSIKAWVLGESRMAGV